MTMLPATFDKTMKPVKYQLMMEEGQSMAVEFHGPRTEGGFPDSFTPPIILSYIASVCCCWILGGIAFALALIGQRKAVVGDTSEAGCLRKASYIMSAFSILVGILILIVCLVYMVEYMRMFTAIIVANDNNRGEFSSAQQQSYIPSNP